jgi:hypothetical protein
MRGLSGFLVAVVFLGLFTTPAAAQDDDWQNKWYWGVQSAAYFYSTPTLDNEMAFEVGGHWLITAERIGLHMALSQLFFGDDATSAIPDGSATGLLVDFTKGRRLQADIYAFPMDGPLQIYAGGGFLINYISDALPAGTFASAQAEQSALEAVDDVSTKAFFTISGGAQWRMGRWAVFGTYQFTPSGRDFLISSTQHAITGGIRYALAASNQDVTTSR